MSSNVEALLKSYEEGNKSSSKENFNYDEKRYFSHWIPKDSKKNVTKRIRILPSLDPDSFFYDLYYGHKATVNDKKQTFACLKKNGIEDSCPFCEMNDRLSKSTNQEEKDLAKDYFSRKMYVLRIIDRDNESDGVKFWRINHSSKNDGVMDKIFSIIKAKNEDISDLENGRDLLIEISLDHMKNPIIVNIIPDDKSRVFEKDGLLETLDGYDKTWKNVYSVKPYDYLALVVKGETPVWDADSKTYVAKRERSESNDESDDDDNDLTLGGSKPDLSVLTKNNDEQEEDDDDDVPF
jgi:hypothetical protein